MSHENEQSIESSHHRRIVELPPHPTDESYSIILYYKYIPIDASIISTVRAELEALCHEHHLSGRIRIATEGINGTNAGTKANIDRFTHLLTTSFDGLFSGMPFKYSECQGDQPPFDCLRVLETKEVTSTGAMAGVQIHQSDDAQGYLKPAEFHAALTTERKPGTLVLDVRNYYEVAIGTFDGAVDPRIRSFNQLAHFFDQNIDELRDRPVLMFCTGGVRCVKARAYLVQKHGCKDVQQLQGGIHEYIKEFGTDGEWKGAMTVFDKRGAVRADGLMLSDQSESQPSPPVPVGRCVQCSGPHDVHNEAHRCLECRCLVLCCDPCFTASRYPLRCEEHVLMAGTQEEKQNLLGRFSLTDLKAFAAELELCIGYAFDQAAHKSRRHKNRRTQLQAQREAVVHEMQRRLDADESISQSADDIPIDILSLNPIKRTSRPLLQQRKHQEMPEGQLLSYMPMLNIGIHSPSQEE